VKTKRHEEPRFRQVCVGNGAGTGRSHDECIRMGGVSDSRADESFVAEYDNACVKKVPLLATF